MYIPVGWADYIESTRNCLSVSTYLKDTQEMSMFVNFMEHLLKSKYRGRVQ